MEPWNKNKSVGQKKPFTARQVEDLKEILTYQGAAKELALFSFGIDSMLLCIDLLKLKVEDVVDFKGQVKTNINLRQKKTKQSHIVVISESTAKALDSMIKKERKYESDWLFTSERFGNQKSTPMSREKYTLLVKKWCKMLHLDPRDYSTHSLRRTRAAMVYKATGNNIRLVQQLLGHKSITSTAAYLNLDQQQAFEVYKEFLD